MLWWGYGDGLGMMGAGGGLGLFGLFWILVWTVNSVLVGVLLWTLIKKYAK